MMHPVLGENIRQEEAMSTKSKVCFLICPMGDPKSETRRRSLRLRDTIIRPAMELLNFDLEDFLEDQGSTESIRERMKQFIATADLCIADLTESNPNVFFEYGLRRATGRPVLAFIHEGQKLTYDVDDYYTQPYDLGKPASAIEAIEKLAQKIGIGFVKPTLQVDVVRKDQTTLLCNYIAEKKPTRVDILQFSLLALRERLFEALWKSPETVVRLLLVHPDCAGMYSKYGRKDVLQTEDLVRELPERTRTFAPQPRPPCPTVGLWYYKHQPSAAAVIVDDKLLQLGWYFHEPTPGSQQIFVRGNDQPSVLALDKDALKLLGPISDRFSSVLSAAEWVLGVGARANDLHTEWEALRQQADSRGNDRVDRLTDRLGRPADG